MAAGAGIVELVQRLQSRQTAVYLVSGGFRPIINPIAELLHIPLENVYANTILHDVSDHRLDLAQCCQKEAHALMTADVTPLDRM